MAFRCRLRGIWPLLFVNHNAILACQCQCHKWIWGSDSINLFPIVFRRKIKFNSEYNMLTRRVLHFIIIIILFDERIVGDLRHTVTLNYSLTSDWSCWSYRYNLPQILNVWPNAQSNVGGSWKMWFAVIVKTTGDDVSSAGIACHRLCFCFYFSKYRVTAHVWAGRCVNVDGLNAPFPFPLLHW